MARSHRLGKPIGSFNFDPSATMVGFNQTVGNDVDWSNLDNDLMNLMPNSSLSLSNTIPANDDLNIMMNNQQMFMLMAQQQQQNEQFQQQQPLALTQQQQVMQPEPLMPPQHIMQSQQMMQQQQVSTEWGLKSNYPQNIMESTMSSPPAHSSPFQVPSLVSDDISSPQRMTESLPIIQIPQTSPSQHFYQPNTQVLFKRIETVRRLVCIQ